MPRRHRNAGPPSTRRGRSIATWPQLADHGREFLDELAIARALELAPSELTRTLHPDHDHATRQAEPRSPSSLLAPDRTAVARTRRSQLPVNDHAERTASARRAPVVHAPSRSLDTKHRRAEGRVRAARAGRDELHPPPG
jgi:hypothetical protein